MNMSIFKISLDIHDEASQLSFSVKKGDTSRRLYITLTENGIPYKIGADCYAVFYAKKPDGTEVFNDCVIEDNTVIYDMTVQTTAASGRCECELVLYGGNGEQLTSPRFSVIVYTPVHTESEITSTSEYTALANLVTEGNSLVTEGNSLIKEVEIKLTNGDFSAGFGTPTSTAKSVSYDKNPTVKITASGEEKAKVFNFDFEIPKGYSPKISDEDIEGGKRIYIKDETETHSFDVVTLPEIKRYANSLKGKALDSIVRADDLSPIEHPVKVGLSSKNLLPYPYSNTTMTTDGITFTDNGDGTITINGTSVTGARFKFSNVMKLPKGNYVLSGGIKDAYVVLRTLKNQSLQSDTITPTPNFTITDDEDIKDIYIYIGANKTFSNVIIKPQIEAGTTATAYTPYVSDTQAVTVTSCGKNVIDVDKGLNDCFVKDGDVYTIERQSSIRWSLKIPCHIPAHCKFSLSAKLVEYTGTHDAWLGYQLDMKDGTSLTMGHVTGYNSMTSYVDSDVTSIMLYIEGTNAVGTYVKFKNLQIEIGDTATAYEPYKEGKTVITTISDGATLQSIAPYMTVSTDTSGVQIEADYNKDINVVIGALTNAIISLGGNV